MKFVSKHPTEREAKAGAIRTVTKFAWWPINCDDGHTYWLRRVVIEQQAIMQSVYNLYGPNYKAPRWRVLLKWPKHKLAEARLLLKGDNE